MAAFDSLRECRYTPIVALAERAKRARIRVSSYV